ncbi:MAG: porin family protein [Bacteroidota bacterium]
MPTINYSLFIPIFLLSVVNLSAQNTSIGLKAGFLQSSISNFGNEEAKTGFRVGAMLTYSINKDFGLGAEANFARKGGVDNADRSINLDYLEIPLFAQYFFGSGSFRPKVMLGPYYALLLQAQREGQELTSYEDQDYGLLLGLGFHKSLGGGKWLYVDGRYSFGIANIVANTERTLSDFSLNAGISFPLGNY